MNPMERHAKNVTAFILVAFLALAILCSTFTAPGQALASASDCSENPSPMTMVGCENPSFLCGFNPASNLLAYGALTSARSADSVKDMLGLAVGASVIDISGETAPLGVKEGNKVSLAEPGKVSIHLLNSILNL